MICPSAKKNKKKIPPKIEWSDSEVRRRTKKSTQEITRNTEPECTFNRLTSRNHVRQERSAFDKLIPKQSKINTTEHVTRKRFLPGQKIFFPKFSKEYAVLGRGNDP